MKSYDVGIIGGGASGMMAAISAKRCGVSVALFEKNDILGKKILATGNGRCNFTNEDMDPGHFYSDDESCLRSVLSEFTKEDTLSFFSDLGILYHQREGYYYPRNHQASAIRSHLSDEVYALGVDVYLNTEVMDLDTDHNRFVISCKDRSFSFQKLILCSGGLAYPQGGNTGDGYGFAKGFSHSLKKPLPALVPLDCSEPYFKFLKGVRAFGKVSLYLDGSLTASDTGELQFTKSGISGIPVFNISRFATRGLEEKKKVEGILDFFPDIDEETLLTQIQTAVAKGSKNAFDSLSGFIHEKILNEALHNLHIPPEKAAELLTKEDIRLLCHNLKNWKVRITDFKDYEFAQVTCGGIPLSEVDDHLQSVYHNGLYFAGELLNADAICGGYNLQWAWSSGHVAGCHAAKMIRS